MLTLSRDPKKKDTKLIDMFSKSQKRRRTPIATVYFTHDQSDERQNQAPATGVAHMPPTCMAIIVTPIINGPMPRTSARYRGKKINNPIWVMVLNPAIRLR